MEIYSYKHNTLQTLAVYETACVVFQDLVVTISIEMDMTVKFTTLWITVVKTQIKAL